METKQVSTKVKDTANKAVSAIKSNPLPTLYIIGGIVGAFALYKIIASVRDNLVLPKDDPEAGGGSPTITNPSLVISGATITSVQAQTLAARLLSAMDGWGGAGQAEFLNIVDVLRGKTPVDYALISEAFGKPRRSIFTGEESVLILGGEALSLSQWLSVELSTNQFAELKKIAPGLF